MFIGIDPGLSGAIAGIKKNGELWVLKVPTFKNAKGKTKYLIGEMVNILEGENITGVALESVHAMPGQGVTSMFSMGQGLGIWQGVLTALKIPFVMVPPQTWQKAVLVGFKRKAGEAKQASIKNARRKFPKFSFLRTPRCKKIDDGMTDATNLALYAKLHFK